MRKRLLAMLMAGCMLVQPLPGAAVTALGAEADSGVAQEISGSAASDMEEALEIIEEASPDVSEGNENFSLNGGAEATGGGTEILSEEILDESDFGIPVQVNESGDGEDEFIQEEEPEDAPVLALIGTSEADAAEVEAIQSDGQQPSKSYIEVKVVAGQMFVPKGGLKVTVRCSKVGDSSFSLEPKTVTLREEKEKPEDSKDSDAVKFGVDPGTYKVTVSADRYANYEQEISVKAYQCKKICVSTARMNKDENTTATSGWARLGDVTGDGQVGDEDTNDIMNVLLGNNKDAGDAAGSLYNLNAGLEPDDEKIDIADLQIAVQNKAEAEQPSSVEEQQIPQALETEAGTQIDAEGGKLEDLFSGDAVENPVKLKPAEGSTISEETPVAISFPLASEGEDGTKLGGITIQAPLNLDSEDTETPEENKEGKKASGISSGWIEVESTEGDKPVIYLVAMTDDTEIPDSALKPQENIAAKKLLKVPVPAEEESDSESPESEETEVTDLENGEPSTDNADEEAFVDDIEKESASGDTEEETDSIGLGEEEPASEDMEEQTDFVDLGDEGFVEVVSIGDEETSPSNAEDEAFAADVNVENQEPIEIDLGDVILNDMAEIGSAGLDLTTASNMTDMENGTSDAGMDDAVSEDAEVIVIPDEPVPQADAQEADTDAEADNSSGQVIPRKKLEGSTASVASDGSIVMDFGKQVAVKKVTIKITGTTKKDDSLVNISKVEFVNDMASRIPEPELNTPKLTLKPGNEEILVTWEKESNVTGYELEITGIAKKQTTEKTQTVLVAGTKHTFTGIDNNDLRNFKPYKIRARSINGEWRSPWSDIQEATPKPDARPEPVDNLKIKAGYRSLSLNWKDMDDASGYMVFYGEDSDPKNFKPVVEGAGTYQPKDNTEAEVNQSGEGRITTNSYTLTGLEDGKMYWVYVIGWNELGWGTYKGDRILSEMTESTARPQLPKYHAINLPEKDDESTIGKLTPHIESADCSWYDANPNNHSVENDKKKAPRMVDSKIDGCVAEEGDTTPNRTNSAKGVVDNDYESYWQKYDWDEGYVYNGYGIHVKLDKAYDMGYLTYSAYNIESEFAGGYVERAKIYYRDTTTDEKAAEQVVPAYVYRRHDVNNQLYYVVMFQKAVKANEIRLCLGRGYGDFWMRVGEMRFHECDEWYDGIMNLFADEMHSSLKPEVTAERLAELETGLETEVNGEKHPLYDSLRLELDLAKKLFEDREKAQKVFKVDTRLTTNSDSHLKFGGLNAWQPLGKVAAQGETMVIYVGHDTKWAGEASNLQLVFTQYHAQSNELNSTVNLKIGRNEVTAPVLTREGRERGGQVYIQYTGTRGSAEKYEVRALGGQDIPVLNIYKMESGDKESGDKKTAAIETYVRELDEYVKTIQTTHDRLRSVKDGAAADAAWKSNVDFAYTDRNCLLNATDLMMDYMMYSVPALQVWKGITNNADVNTSLSDAEVTAAAKRLETSLDAMEDTMKLFYQHKGLTDDPEAVKNEVNGKNEMPVKHLNIRYMQMFAGAFMYASGNHIGVEYPETNVAGGAASWDSFGWGIAHEIGHDINQSWYAIAEITNNYFAQLLTKAYNGTRFKYEIDPNDEKAGDPANDIYSKVTSGTLGRSANGAVQLGLYWQLHLAFDNYTINNKGMTNNTLNDTTSKVSSYPYTDDRYVFNDYNEQFNNLFFARVDTYGRNPSKAPHDGVTLASGAAAVDQNLMRLSCAAANANILPFFERWGMVPDEGTLAYAEKFGKATTKALYYVNDDARDYRAAHPGEPDNILNKDVIESAVANADLNKVSITVTPKADAKGEVLLGYEIIRGMYSNGKIKKDVVGFKLADGNKPVTYIDEIATINNRVMYYEVKAVDQYLNYSNVKDAGSVKIETNGALPKSEWTIETTMTSAEDVTLNPNPSFAVEPDAYVDNGKDDPDGGFDSDMKKVSSQAKKVEHSIDKIADRDENSAYIGENGTNASITIDLHDFCEVTSLIYRGDELGEVTVSVSTNNTDWTQVKKVDMKDENQVSKDGSATTIWFDAISDDPAVKEAWIGTYEARYVKLAFSKAGKVQIAEIDICGPTGDNLEFKKAEGDQEAGQVALGVLSADYKYSDGADKTAGTEDDDIIPKGSLVFTGSYKGNPAYNVVVLYDGEGNVIGVHENENGELEVKSEQVIFANVPAKGNLGETSSGTWVYYLEPEVWKDEATLKETVKGRIRGELYRVDNALTNANERIVSDTQFITLPDELPEITMIGGGLPAASAEQETEGGTE